MLIFFNCSSDCASPMSRALPRKLALLVIAPLFLDSVFPGFGFTSSKPCYRRAGWRNLHRCDLTRLATAASSGQGFGEYTDTLRSLPPERRLQHDAKLKRIHLRAFFNAVQAMADALDPSARATKNRRDEGRPGEITKRLAQQAAIVYTDIRNLGAFAMALVVLADVLTQRRGDEGIPQFLLHEMELIAERVVIAHTDSLRSLPPEMRLQYMTSFKDEDPLFGALADALTKNREDEGIPPCVLHVIKQAAENVGIVIAGVDKGGSTCTRTAIKYSSDLDLNVRATRNMTRDDRVNFKDALVDLLPQWTDGWTFVHMGKKCVKLEKESKPGGPICEIDMAFMNTTFIWSVVDRGQKREIDIAFMNTTFIWSVVDRAENVAFFHNNQVAQRAVKVFKFCFLDVSRLCGFHIERLAMAVCEKGQKDFTAKQLFDVMLEKLCHNSVELQRVFDDAIEEGLNERDRQHLNETLTRQISKMRNVCKNAGL